MTALRKTEYSNEDLQDLLERIADDGDRNLSEFFECYIDPEGPFRYAAGDAWDAINYIIDHSPDLIADAINEYAKEAGWSHLYGCKCRDCADDRGDHEMHARAEQ